MKQILVIVVLFIGGCVGHFAVPSKDALQQPFPPINEEAKTTLVGSALSYERLENEGIAILAVLRGGPLGLRLNMAFELFQGLRFYFPKVRVIPYRDTVLKIKEAGRLPKYRAFVTDYETDRFMDTQALKTWAEIEGVRYLFIGQVRSNAKHTATQTMKLGEDSVSGSISATASGPTHIPYDVEKEVSIVGEVWDSQCGQAIWMGISSATVSEPVETERVRVEDIFTLVSRNLIASFDQAMRERRGQNSPPEC